eukprot:5050409-Pyramimonas_sp.AAC.1
MLAPGALYIRLVTAIVLGGGRGVLGAGELESIFELLGWLNQPSRDASRSSSGCLTVARAPWVTQEGEVPAGEYSPLTPQEMLTKDVDDLKVVVKDRREAAQKEKDRELRAKERDREERERAEREVEREREEAYPKRNYDEDNQISTSHVHLGARYMSSDPLRDKKVPSVDARC